VAGRRIVPELIQGGFTPARVAEETARYFADPPITWPKPAKGVPDPPFADKLAVAPESSSGAFTVTIAGRKMRVLYK